MKTIQIYKADKKLIKKLYKEVLVIDANFHYFYEPDLIIRTNFPKKLIAALPKDIEYEVYDYPYPKKKHQFGESKKYYRYQSDLEKLYHWQALIALKTKGKTANFITNRSHHCLLNMMGFEYYDESLYYLEQSYNYMPNRLSKGLLKFIYKIFSY